MKETELILEELMFRREEDYDLRFSPREILSSYLGFSIVSRNNWKGIMKDSSLIVPSIYDNITVQRLMDHTLFITEIMNEKGLWCINQDTGIQLLEPLYDDIIVNSSFMGVLLKSDKNEGLYSLSHNRIIFDPIYKKVGINTSSLHIWAQTDDNNYIFQNLLTGGVHHIHRNKEITPIEHKDFSGFINSDGQVEFIEGDSKLFRMLVAKAGGRLKLCNSRSGHEFVSDAAGFILNF